MTFGQAPLAQLHFQVGDNRAEIGVAAAFPVAVDGALDLHRPGPDRCESIGNGALAVVVSMDSERMADFGAHGTGDGLDLPRHRPAIRITQDDGLSAALDGGTESLQSVHGVGFVAVEEMLCIVDDTAIL